MRFGLRSTMAVVGIGVFVVTLLGIPARATYGAQTSADEPQYLLTALSIAQDGDLDIADERDDEAYRAFHEASLPVQTVLRPDGSRLSPHNPLLPLYLALPMQLGGWVAAKIAMALVAGALAALVVWVGVVRFGVDSTTAAVVVGVFGLSPPLALYATQVYPELPAALAVTVGIAALTGSPSRRTVAALVLAVVALPWLAVKYVPVAAVLAIAGVWWLRRRPQLPAFLALLALAGVVYIWFNQVVYGGWTPYAAGDFFVDGELTALGPDPNYVGRSRRLLGLWVDRGFGIVAWQPAYLLGVAGLAWVVHRRPRAWHLLVTVLGVGWLVATFVAQTMHGWWWPGRQLVVVLPALVLVVMLWVGASNRRRTSLVAIGSLGIVAFLFLVIEATAGHIALIVDFVDTANPFYRLWSTVLPDYMTVTGATWFWHGMWLVVFAAIATVGWRSARLTVSAGDVRYDPAS